ncbi:hypothetical protein RQP46_000354 [Phenoliferia psychrophenolica]
MNVSLYAVPAAWLVSIFPHWYAVALTKIHKGDMPGFRNSSPREFVARCQATMGTDKKNPTIARYLRSEAASQNGMENIALFAASIVVGNFAGLSVDTLNTNAAIYLVARVIYNVHLPLWLYCLGACFYLFIQAGHALNK